MARRSTRLSSKRNSSTPKRVSLSHDAPARTPKTAPVKLSTLDENEDMPGAFPQSASPPEHRTPSFVPPQGMKIPVHFNDTTPKQSSPIKPTHDEMHPAQHHQTTAKPFDEARWLGFANMPQTEPPKQSSKIGTLQGTPTRTSNTQSGITAPQYQFTFHREHSLELSPEAKRLMFEKREEAARIREQMVADGEGPEDVEAAIARKIATPGGKNGRYSQAHLDQFKKMDSIANHASAFRANPTWKKPSPAQPEPQHKVPQSASKSLKRSPSKAKLDEPDRAPAHFLTRSPSKPSLFTGGSSLPRATSSKNLVPSSESRETSPAKRVKRFQGDDATITRPSSSGSDVRQPGTPSPIKQQPTYPDLTSLASPTQASLPRAASVKSAKTSKIPAPALARSPSKAKLNEPPRQSAGPSTPLLARSPSKVSFIAQPNLGGAKQDTPTKTASPLLVRSPVKGPLFKKQGTTTNEHQGALDTSLLSRSPMKMSVSKNADVSGSTSGEAQQKKKPFLARSPMKMSTNNHAGTHDQEMKEEHQQKPSKTPLFSRSPLKMSIQRLPDHDTSHQPPAFAGPSASAAKQSASDTAAAAAETPTKSSNKSLMDRFSFLRSSPVKSILRSPHRLYSDDPAKVAAGTHLATPPKKTASEMNKKLAAAPKTAPNRKQVDFSSSTKARYERAQSEVNSTPSKENTPMSTSEDKVEAAPKPTFAQYPSLPTVGEDMTITPQKRRQTIAPGDFTFRAGPDGIVFGTSPNAPASMAGKRQRPSTIRHVSAEPTLLASTTKKRKFEFENDKATHEDGRSVAAPATTSKKRKFEFENSRASETDAAGAMSDKENDGEQEVGDDRPAKRVKQSAPSPEKQQQQQQRRGTLGVRPKGEVKGGRSASGGASAKGAGAGAASKSAAAGKEKTTGATISQARLAALAQPKRRG